MLTAAQRERCRELAQALDRGDSDAYRRAEDSLTPEMKGEVWDQRAHVKAMAGRGRKKTLIQEPGSRFSSQPEAAVIHDLDYWSDSEPVEPDDDDPMPVCGACDGRGKDSEGNVCTACGGSGRIPAEDQEDGDDDGEDDE